VAGFEQESNVVPFNIVADDANGPQSLPDVADVQALLSATRTNRAWSAVKRLQKQYTGRDWLMVKTSDVWTTLVSVHAPDGTLVVADADKWIERQSLSRSAVERLIAESKEKDWRFKKTEMIIHMIIGTVTSDPLDFVQFRFSLDTDLVCPVRDIDSWHVAELAGGLSSKWETAARSLPAFVAHPDGMLHTPRWRKKCESSWTLQRENQLHRLQHIVTRLHRENGELGPPVPYLERHPLPEDWLDEPAREQRWFWDWQRSSAGAVPMGRHWWLDPKDYVDEHNVRIRNFIPRPIVWPKAKIEAKRKTCFRLMDELAQFDRKVGHPFAWFFHMAYGNRVSDVVGETIADGIRHGEIHLPRRDEAVLMDWIARPYCF
jgi:hypothetical protein